MGAGALTTAEEIALKEGEVVIPGLDKLPVPEALAASGARSRPSLQIAGSRDVFAPLALRRMVEAGAEPVLEVHDVTMLAGATGDSPDPGSYPGDFLEVTLGELEAGGEPEGGWGADALDSVVATW